MPITRHVADMVEEAKGKIENLSVDQLAAELESKEALVVDIRDVRERIERGAIPGSVHAPRGMLEFWADPESQYYRPEFDADRRTILYCAGGGRSALAARALQEMGFADVAHLEPGFGGWASSGRPVEDVASTSKWVKRDPAG